jgi:DNA polymerase III delta prime subunit
MQGLFQNQITIDTNNEVKKNEKNDQPKLKKIKEIKYTIDNIGLENYSIKELYGCNDLSDNLLSQYCSNKLSHANIISGEYGIGKATFVYNLIYKVLLAEINDYSSLNMNDIYEALNNHVYPDIYILNSTENGKILIEDIRKMLDFLLLKPIYKTKFIIIDDINAINNNGLNAILKTIEEPTSNTYFFIIDHGFNSVPKTILSRCNKYRLQNNISFNDFQKIIKIQYPEFLNQEINFQEIYKISNGSIAISKYLLESNIFNSLNKEFDNIKKKDSSIDNIVNKIASMVLNHDIIKKIRTDLKWSIFEKIIYYFIINGYNYDNIEELTKITSVINNKIYQFKKYDLLF